MIEKIKHIPVRFIAGKANVDSRTVSKFLKGNKVMYSKEISIKKAINLILKEESDFKNE